MKKLICLITAMVCFAGAVFADTYGATLPKGSSYKIEDFEEGYVWLHAGADWDRWGDHHVSSGAELARKWKTSGKYSMQLSYDHMVKEDKALWYTDYTSGSYLDISAYDYVAIDVYNPFEWPLLLGFCMQDKNWEWMNSDDWIWFPTGEHTLVFSLKNIPANKRSELARLMLMQPLNTGDEGYLYVDNIRGYR